MNLTRRKFLKGSSAALLGLAAGTVFTESPAKAAQDDSGTQNNLESRYNVDILIVGSGQAGLSAGLHALELGVKNVMIMDKMSGEGHDYAGSSMVCSGNFLHPADDSEEAREAYVDDIWNYSLQKTDRSLIEVLGERAFGLLNWMKEQGVVYKEPTATGNGVYASNMVPIDTMPLLLDNFINNGGQTLFGAKAEKLNINAAGVCGVLAKDADGYFNIIAKKTILCMGGYASNKSFLSDHVGDFAEGIVSRARSITVGDGVFMVQDVGGYTVGVNGKNSLYLGAAAAVSPVQGQVGSWTQQISVNAEGRRFVDETLVSETAPAILDQTDQKCAYIFDAKGYELLESKIEEKITGQGIPLIQEDTLEKLAQTLDWCPADELMATVTEYNAHISDEKVTGLNVNKEKDAFALDTAPYYALYPVIVGMSLTYGGIAVNTKGEVLQADGAVIPNLYAAGELIGGFFYKNYYGGSQMAKAAVFGHVAVETAIETMEY